MSLAVLRKNVTLPLGILLILAFQGLFDTVPTLFYVASGSVIAESTHQEHSKYCLCKDCSGAKNLNRCCCVKAKTGAQSMAFAAVCDTPKDSLQAAEQSPRAMSDFITVAILLPLIIPLETSLPRRFDTQGRVPKPLFLPPRSV